MCFSVSSTVTWVITWNIIWEFIHFQLKYVSLNRPDETMSFKSKRRNILLLRLLSWSSHTFKALGRPIHDWVCSPIQESFYCTRECVWDHVMLKNEASANQMLSKQYYMVDHDGGNRPQTITEGVLQTTAGTQSCTSWPAPYMLTFEPKIPSLDLPLCGG